MIWIFTLFISFAHAKTHMLVAGGGGDPAGPTTMFDQTFSQAALLFKSLPGIEFDMLFDGSHSGGKETVRSSLGKKTDPDPFNEETLTQRLEAMYEKIIKGQITSKDQVLIMIYTHGEKPGAEGVETHKVMTDQGKVSLDLLKKITEETNKRGIKTAIVDTSCYSGNSQALANENTCVVSAAGTHQVAYSDFSDNIIRAMNNDGNLEDAFLMALQNTNNASQPGISTNAGKEVQTLLRDIQFMSGFKEDMEIATKLHCAPNAEAKQAIQTVVDIGKMSLEILMNDICKTPPGPVCASMRRLKEAAGTYSRKTVELSAYANRVHQVSTGGSTSQVYGWNEIAAVRDSDVAKLKRELANPNTPQSEKGHIQATLIYSERLLNVKNELKKSHTEFAWLVEQLKTPEDLQAMAEQRTADLRRVQAYLYGRNRKRTEKNACNQFRL